MPSAKRHRYANDLGLSAYDARVLTDDHSMAKYFEEVISGGIEPKAASNWITGDISAYLNTNKKDFSQLPFLPIQLAEMIELISKGKISGKIAKEILPELLLKGGSPKKLVDKLGLGMISDVGLIEKMVNKLIEKYPDEVTAFKGGKKKLLGFFVGQLMKETSGKVDPKLANQILNTKLNA